ncbi:cell surface antigen [Streptococcus anginosus]|uniref:Cell surface antigen n=1 Tax=Streptococcus anginosus TaxID=1328 RepID=A0A3S4MVM0_STRAP|nr:hypothetical protein [Streptococcus anginosus]VED98964.1 cell surface antigen [Streptococcus anginosus]
MKSNETKTYGSIRKIKAYGACGVILGLAALAVATAQTSYADEATTTPKRLQICQLVSLRKPKPLNKRLLRRIKPKEL